MDMPKAPVGHVTIRVNFPVTLLAVKTRVDTDAGVLHYLVNRVNGKGERSQKWLQSNLSDIVYMTKAREGVYTINVQNTNDAGEYHIAVKPERTDFGMLKLVRWPDGAVFFSTPEHVVIKQGDFRTRL